MIGRIFIFKDKSKPYIFTNYFLSFGVVSYSLLTFFLNHGFESCVSNGKSICDSDYSLAKISNSFLYLMNNFFGIKFNLNNLINTAITIYINLFILLIVYIIIFKFMNEKKLSNLQKSLITAIWFINPLIFRQLMFTNNNMFNISFGLLVYILIQVNQKPFIKNSAIYILLITSSLSSSFIYLSTIVLILVYKEKVKFNLTFYVIFILSGFTFWLNIFLNLQLNPDLKNLFTNVLLNIDYFTFDIIEKIIFLIYSLFGIIFLQYSILCNNFKQFVKLRYLYLLLFIISIPYLLYFTNILQLTLIISTVFLISFISMPRIKIKIQKYSLILFLLYLLTWRIIWSINYDQITLLVDPYRSSRLFLFDIKLYDLRPILIYIVIYLMFGIYSELKNKISKVFVQKII